MNCCMCDKSLEGEKYFNYSFWGNYRPVCNDCWTMICNIDSYKKDVKAESRKRVEELLSENNYDPDIAVELKVRSDIGVSREEKKAAKDYVAQEQQKRIDEENAKVNADKKAAIAAANGTGFVVAGVVFLILSIVLYVVSIKPLDKEAASIFGIDAVANIQCTVFSAASLIVSIILFCCKGLVRYMKR